MVNVPPVGQPAKKDYSRHFNGAPNVGDYLIGDGSTGEHFDSTGPITYIGACIQVKSDITDACILQVENVTKSLLGYIFLPVPLGTNPAEYHTYLADEESAPISMTFDDGDEIRIQFIFTDDTFGSDWIVTLVDHEHALE